MTGAGRASCVIREETPGVRITEWTFGPGCSTGHHRHELDYVIVYLDGGTRYVVSPAGEVDVEVRPGMAYFRNAGIEQGCDDQTRGTEIMRLREGRTGAAAVDFAARSVAHLAQTLANPPI